MNLIKKNNISIKFSKCLTCLCLAILEIEDGFLKKKLNRETQNLLVDFTNLNNKNSINIQKQDLSSNGVKNFKKNGVNHSDTVQHILYVAQCQKLISQLDYFINTLETLQHLEKIKRTTSLLALKHIYSFKSFLLDLNKIYLKPKEAKSDERLNINKNIPKLEIGDFEKKIMNFIKEHNQPVTNNQLFEKFYKYSPKTLRRYTKNLLLKKLLKGQKRGREVVYSLTLEK